MSESRFGVPAGLIHTHRLQSLSLPVAILFEAIRFGHVFPCVGPRFPRELFNYIYVLNI